MPEGPEIRRAADDIAAVLEGQTIEEMTTAPFCALDGSVALRLKLNRLYKGP